jgi:hypothetical protein
MPPRDPSVDDDDLDESDFPDESDMDRDDDPETVPCPYCGEGISEEAEVCPHCRNFISREDAPRRVPLWVILAMAAGAAALFWSMGR